MAYTLANDKNGHGSLFAKFRLDISSYSRDMAFNKR